MKYLLMAVASLMILGAAACKTSVSHDNDYTVNASFDGNCDGLTAYLINYDTGETIDSCLVADNKAAFAGVADSVVLARLTLGNSRVATFIIEPGEITVDSGRVVADTPMNLLLAKFEADVDSLSGLYDAAETDSLRNVAETTYNNFIEEYIGKNHDNPVGYFAFLQAAYEYNADALAARLKQYPSLAGYKRVADLVSAKEREAATSAGHHYADFTISYGDSIAKLSDHVVPGSFTLVDFWASWCGPCRREMPVIKELYEQLHSKGLNVVGVAVWDRPEDSMKAAAQLELPWPQIWDAQRVPTDLYGISGIPHIMLIDPEGIIVARGMQGDSLRRVVTESVNGYVPAKTTVEPVATAQN